MEGVARGGAIYRPSVNYASSAAPPAAGPLGRVPPQLFTAWTLKI